MRNHRSLFDLTRAWHLYTVCGVARLRGARYGGPKVHFLFSAPFVQRREQMVQRREQMVRRREQNNGAEKRTNGAEKRTNGAEKRTNGAEKRTNGAEKRTNGAEKRKCTLGPP